MTCLHSRKNDELFQYVVSLWGYLRDKRGNGDKGISMVTLRSVNRMNKHTVRVNMCWSLYPHDHRAGTEPNVKKLGNAAFEYALRLNEDTFKTFTSLMNRMKQKLHIHVDKNSHLCQLRYAKNYFIPGSRENMMAVKLLQRSWIKEPGLHVIFATFGVQNALKNV